MKFISLLRGINIGGHKKILMADLKDLYKKLGFTQIVSFIQSGNVIFDCENVERGKIRKSIEQAITKQYGFDVPVIIRTYDEIKKAYDTVPFDNIDLASEGSKYFLTLLNEKPSEQNCELLMRYVKSPEQMLLEDLHIDT
jgi:uncharacterized protein (DUF1697 family)